MLWIGLVVFERGLAAVHSSVPMLALNASNVLLARYTLVQSRVTSLG